MTPLTLACERNQPAVVEILVKHPDIQIERADHFGWRPTHHAARYGRLDILFSLLLHNAQVNVRTRKLKDTPLILACLYGKDKLVEDSPDFPGCIRLLLDNGADVNMAEEEGWTPLHTLCRYSDDVDMARTLIGHWAGVNTKDPDDYTPLIHAVYRGCVATLETLLEHGAVINCQEKEGATPLYSAAELGFDNCMEALIRAGADVNLTATDGTTPLIRACDFGHAKCAEVLLRNGADFTVQDEEGGTALYTSTEEGHFDCIELLLKAGADPKQRAISGCTALQVATSCGRTECLELLLPLSDIDAVDNKGRTALYWACKNGKEKCAELLIRIGADANVCRADGRSPYDIAAKKKHLNIVRLLSDARQLSRVKYVLQDSTLSPIY